MADDDVPQEGFLPKKKKTDEESEKRRKKITPGSLLKAIIREGNGTEKPVEGDQVIFHCTTRTLEGVVVDSTRSEHGGKGYPSRHILGKSKMILGFLEGIPTMSMGEVAMFKMKPELHYAEEDCPVTAPDTLPKDDELHFEVEMLDFHKSKVVSEDLGVTKKIITEGQGWENPREPYEVKAWISAKSTDGKMVLSRSQEPYSFTFGKSELPRGLEMGIGTMARGEKAAIYVNKTYLTPSPIMSTLESYEEVQFVVELVHFIQHSTVYQISRPWVLTNFAGYGKDGQTEARFVIPEVKKLASDGRAKGLTIIFVSKELEGSCIWGKLQVDSLCLSLEKCVTLSLGHRADMLSAVIMKHGILESKYLDKGDCIVFHSHNVDATSTCKVQVSICAQAVGACETSPYDSYSYDDVPSSSLPHIIRLRSGNVLFNYRYYNNMLQKTEVTEDFSCPFCLVKCSSFKGLRFHLTSCHDLFNFEFWVTEEYQAVNVSVRTDIWTSEVLLDGTDSRLQTFSYCSNLKRRGRSKNLVVTGSHVHPHALESGSTEVALEGYHDNCNNNATCSSHRPLAYAMDVSLVNGCSDGMSYKGGGRGSKSLFNETHLHAIRNKTESITSHNGHALEGREPLSSSPEAGVCVAAAQASTSSEFAQQASGTNSALHNMLQFGKMRKICDDRTDPRNRQLLQKRQFIHSHRAQPMAMEQIVSDNDSEGEVDDDIADFEDRRMLDDFVDVTKDEKHIMHLWNSFVRKQRVLADGHIPWACEAFCRLHGPNLIYAPSLLWNWRLLMIKLWNHNLLDPRTFDNCSLILEKLQNGSPGPSQS